MDIIPRETRNKENSIPKGTKQIEKETIEFIEKKLYLNHKENI
ncbi:hypothetical protein Q6A87_08530 [Aliarcobacter skirrowii]|nr:hypothetical protein [Aliarcobacter skirrowii]MDX4067893.1 hypothetical protein [Aliarcobacter skirrowii]